MASYCGKDFVKLLPELYHTGNEFDWMFQLEKESNVINSICRYVDPNAILEEYEMESFLEWEAINTFEDVDSLELHKSSKIWGALDDNSLLEEEMAASETLLICLPKRASKLKSLLEPSQEEANNSQHEFEQARQRCRLAEDGCRTFSCSLFESYSELVKDFETSALSFRCDAICEETPWFLVHYSQDEIRHNRERLANIVSSALTSLSSTPVSVDTMSPQPGSRSIIDGDETSYKRLLKLIAMLVSKLLKVTIESIFLGIDQESILASNAAFKDLLKQISLGKSISSETVRAFDIICYDKIKTILQKTEKNKIVIAVMNKFDEECKSLEVEYCLKIDRLNEISTIIQEQKGLNLMMGLLCQIDNASVQRIEKLLHCFIGMLPDYKKKIKKESNAIEHNSFDREQSTSSLPPPMALAALQDAPKCTVDVMRKLFTQANKAVIFKQEEILASIRFLVTYFSQKMQITNKLEDYIISGTTMKPVVVNYKHLLSLQDHEKELENLTKKLLEAHSAVAQLESNWRENPSSWALRLLWVPFMNGKAERLEAVASGDFSVRTIKKNQSQMHSHIGSHRKREWSSVKKERNN